MTIKDIVVSVLRHVGREDIATEMESGGEPSGEGGEVVQTALYCVYATEDELARYYFPLEFTERLTSDNGRYSFSDFTHTPIKILSVRAGGSGEIKYSLETNGLVAPATAIDITYRYTAKRGGMDSESVFGEMADGAITALGAAAEYCLLSGEAAMAQVWETRYREAIDRARKNIHSGAYIPPRRWV